MASVQREERRSRRLHHDLPVAYRTRGGFLSDWATNISQGGIFINTRAPLPVGTTVRLMVQLPGARFPCDLVGRVARVVSWHDDVRDPPGMGIEFTDIDRERRDRIGELVEALHTKLNPE